MTIQPMVGSVGSDGYRYWETTAAWKALCAALPSFRAIWWPGYATRVVETTLDGEPAVIQLWKGRIEPLFALEDLPGGFGAEVGIYRRANRSMPTLNPGLPDSFFSRIANAVEGLVDQELWWPYPELNAEISFELKDPTSGATIFSAGPERTYWLNKWMALDSYDAYLAGRTGTPPADWDYPLSYTINGVAFSPWIGH